MEKVPLPFGQFGPDKSTFDPDFIDTATNVIPYEKFYGPFPSFNAFTDPLPDRPQGGFLSVLGNGVWIPFAATEDDIYKFEFANSSWVSVGGNSAPFNTGATSKWSFTQFGELVVATNGVDLPQYYDLTVPGGTFQVLSGAPRAKVVTTIGDFLMFGNLPDMSERAVQWSGLNDPFWWTPKQRSSDFQVFPDDGEIMAIEGFEKGIVVFHEHCIREGALALESPLVMAFQKTVENHGTHARNSPVTTGAGTFYLSQDGYYRYMAPTPQKVGVERVDEFFFDECDLNDTFYVFGAEDPARKVIYWAYRSTENDTDQTYDKALVYNYGVDRWAQLKFDFKLTFIFNSVTPGYTLDNLHETGYTLDSLPYSLDSRVWSGSLPTFAAFDEDYRLGFFSSTPMKAILQTCDIPLSEARRSVVQGFTPLCDAVSTKGRVAKKDFHGQAKTWGTQHDNNTETGVIYARSSGLLHRFEVEIPADQEWKEIHGIEVQKVVGGRR